MPTNIDTSEIPDFEVHDGYTKKFFSQNQTGNGRNNRRIRYLRHSFLWVRRYSKRSGNNCTPVKKPIKGRQLKILLKAIDKSNINLAKNNILAGFVF